METWLATPVD